MAVPRDAFRAPRVASLLRSVALATALVLAPLAPLIACGAFSGADSPQPNADAGPAQNGDGATLGDGQSSADDGGVNAIDSGITETPSDSTLKALSLSGIALTPVFSPPAVQYTGFASISRSPLSTVVTATPNTPNATVVVNQVTESGSVIVQLPPGQQTTIPVQVTSVDTTSTKLYDVDVTGVTEAYVKSAEIAQSAKFGGAVAMSADGKTLAVGSVNTTVNAVGQVGTVDVYTNSGTGWSHQTTLEPTVLTTGLQFGAAVAISSDGNTVAIGAPGDSSAATTINGSEAAGPDSSSGAAFLFSRSGGNWIQQAYVKAPNTRANAAYGSSVALSADGNTLAVGSVRENSNATGINGNANDQSTTDAGAVYIVTRAGALWSQGAYIKASNTSVSMLFGSSVALNSDGSTLAVGAIGESSAAMGINGSQTTGSITSSGAAYVFSNVGGSGWVQNAYIKASNNGPLPGAEFGYSVSLSLSGGTLVVSAPGEDSKSTGINGNQMDTSASGSGAVYAFTRAGATWTQQAYIKASNTQTGASFGSAVSLANDGNALAVGSNGEEGSSTGVNGPQNSGALGGAGAAYVFLRTGSTWAQSVYIKPSNTRTGASFGSSISMTGDGVFVAVGSPGESSANDMPSNSSAQNAGAVYVY